MAIDTAEKRRSVSGVHFEPWMPAVTPNATHDQQWRQEVAGAYAGILAGGGVAVVARQTNPFIASTGVMTSR